MSIRFALSNLTKLETRQMAARWLLFLCAVGYLVTLSVLFATGVGLRGWLFTLFAWGLFVYLPLRILLETFQTIGPQIRRRLLAQTAVQPTRYATRASIELMVDGMLDREVVLPRIAKPVQRSKAQEGAVAVLLRVGRGDLARHRDAVLHCLAAVDRWITSVAGWARGGASENIQARWADLRALVAFVAMTKTLLATYRDRRGEAVSEVGTGPRNLDEYLDTCLDYCDELALKVDAIPWSEPPLDLSISVETREALRRTWMTFCETEAPALDARETFLTALLPPV